MNSPETPSSFLSVHARACGRAPENPQKKDGVWGILSPALLFFP
jgi:hypothetical protein